MYDHSNKIGNKGDLIKHFALTVAAKQMATDQRAFTYLDVHSGRSDYNLPDTGEWRRGIGEFSRYCQNKQIINNDLEYFCKVQSLTNIAQTRKYYGSSRIIMNVLQDVGIQNISPILCDTNPVVCNDLEDQFQDAPLVEICCASGYKKAHSVENVDLVFIDPPNIRDHYSPYMRLLKYYAFKGQPFISWNPLHGNVPKQTMSQNCFSVTEFSEKEQIPHVSVRWAKGWSGQMCGCQMLFSIPQGRKIEDACDALIDLMNWDTISKTNKGIVI